MPSTTDPRTRRLSRAGHDSSVDSAHGGARDHAPATARPASAREGVDPGDGTVRLVDADGVRHPDATYDAWVEDVDHAALLRLYEDMVVVRRIDTEATALQRQGHLALWPPLLGQEAAQIGSARALDVDDFVFSSYREHGVAHVRGIAGADLLRVWRGVTGAGWDPHEARMAPMQVIIGAQALHAVGYAVGILADQETDERGEAPGSGATAGAAPTEAVISYFGDGATSQGDVAEAFTFASTWTAPVVFFCQNNQWAISEPVSLQSKVPLVERARGFGMPGVRVDGNDVLAVLAVTRQALHRARTGGGPTFIEAVTYRRGPHTTADDPTRYRTSAEIEHWEARDPVDRIAAHLRAEGALDDDGEARVQAAADAVAAELRAGVTSIADPSWPDVFADVYAEPHAELDAERDAYARYLDGFETSEGGGR
ncbi:pyruvate dehydrogenase (acetyl-transferring) E1 component subunit alpha [Isoptericola halotolerans]|uniref:Pyruvate dehydrogenase E1 component alpha subunit n=2 Tax=Isoptericola halotolerans TaxID=300560 RepID=A0ABX2A2S4_9MICO|nr:pyruvate dehydrogenase (acetyl-transferring) E1 component subunit alpha [Isoptericola halotolerans]NOV96062.1 pyruvate dehydrogenase E1 component alpha subunit [Isoptericola halotolerans]